MSVSQRAGLAASTAAVKVTDSPAATFFSVVVEPMASPPLAGSTDCLTETATSASLSLAIVVSRLVVTAEPAACSASRSGVVTTTPSFSTCTGSVITRSTSRPMPEPEYQREDGIWWSTRTAMTFCPPKLTKSEMSNAKGV